MHDVVDLGQALVRRPVKLVNNVAPGSLPIVIGDPGRIVQILYNLFGNAGRLGACAGVGVARGLCRGQGSGRVGSASCYYCMPVCAVAWHKNTRQTTPLHPPGVIHLCFLYTFAFVLFSPAAKFTRQGSISISAGTSLDGKQVYLSVSDTGCGVAQDKITQIFGAFQQVWGVFIAPGGGLYLAARYTAVQGDAGRGLACLTIMQAGVTKHPLCACRLT